MFLSWVKQQLDYKNGGSSYSLTEEKKKHTRLGFWLKKINKKDLFLGENVILKCQRCHLLIFPFSEKVEWSLLPNFPNSIQQ